MSKLNNMQNVLFRYTYIVKYANTVFKIRVTSRGREGNMMGARPRGALAVSKMFNFLKSMASMGSCKTFVYLFVYLFILGGSCKTLNAVYLLYYFLYHLVCFSYFILKGKEERAQWRINFLREDQGGLFGVGAL